LFRSSALSDFVRK